MGFDLSTAHTHPYVKLKGAYETRWAVKATVHTKEREIEVERKR